MYEFGYALFNILNEKKNTKTSTDAALAEAKKNEKPDSEKIKIL